MSLKEDNKKALWAVALANALVFYLIVQAPTLAGGGLLEALRSWASLVPAGAALVLVGLLNAQIDDHNKARLVFWRWNNPLPGCLAFTKWGPRDQRVNMSAVELRHGPLPKAPADQNRLWYRLYQSVAKLPAVLQVHRDYLLARDITCMAAIFIVILVPAAFLLMPVQTAAIYAGAIILEFIMATRAARVHGARFVTTVLALKGAGQ